VSYVLTGKRSISEETRRRVQDAIEQLTYQPNAGARALASRRTSVIGLVLPSFGPGTDSAGLLPFIQTITSLARAQDYDVLLATSDEGSDSLRRLAGRSLCDAIILMDLKVEDERVRVASSLSEPVVLIGVPKDSADLQCVDVDFARAAELAVEEMAATGHDRILFVGHSTDVTRRDLNFVSRFTDAAIRTVRHHDLAFDYLPPIEQGRVAAQEVVTRVLPAYRKERLGLIIPNSQTAQPILNALIARGIIPGQDVSIIAHCTDETAEETEPPVTNVSLEPREVSRRAIEIVFRLLDRAQPDPDLFLDLVPSRLTRRATIMPLPDVGPDETRRKVRNALPPKACVPKARKCQSQNAENGVK
jgi:DNA-binding LacI/PurR family transcriptional regulator